MIEAKDAVIAAAKYFTDITGHTGGVIVEEIELSDDEKYWLVTLGFKEREELMYAEKKAYKLFEVDAYTGEVRSMKIRAVWKITMNYSIVERLILKHSSKGILIDTNVLLLFLIGIFDENYIHKFKRTKKYSIEDFHIVKSIILRFKKIIVTPQILAELSNLSCQMDKSRLGQYFSYFIEIIKKSEEIYINKNQLLEINLLSKFGITDLTINESAREYNYLVFTDDFKLFGYLSKNNIDAINLNYIRTELWLRNK